MISLLTDRAHYCQSCCETKECIDLNRKHYICTECIITAFNILGIVSENEKKLQDENQALQDQIDLLQTRCIELENSLDTFGSK